MYFFLSGTESVPLQSSTISAVEMKSCGVNTAVSEKCMELSNCFPSSFFLLFDHFAKICAVMCFSTVRMRNIAF